MKSRALLASLVLSVLPLGPGLAQVPAPVPPAAPDRGAPNDSIAAELTALVNRVKVKTQRANQRTARDLAPELAQFEALRQKYAGQKSDAVARIALMHATLYYQVLADLPRAITLLRAVRQDFPGTETAQSVDRLIPQLEEKVKLAAARDALVGRPAPELTFTWSSREGLRNLASLKGRVVVLQFWTTSSGPCLSTFPATRDLVARFKDHPVSFLGVTSLQGKVAGLEVNPIDTTGNPAREQALMNDFIKANAMTWDVVFSAEPVFNPAYGIEGIPMVVLLAPDGTVRHTGLHPADPAGDLPGKIAALLKEFNLAAPNKVRL